MIVGLTGGIGSGKSAAGDFFIELGIDLIDADMISKDILDNNSKIYSDCKNYIPVCLMTIATWYHLIPFRTQK